MLRLGSVELATRLLLAPIARYCDLAFRLTIRPLGGLGLAYTDLVNPRGLLRRTAKSMELVRTESGDQPLCVQLYGSEVRPMADAARWCQDHGAAIIDINMGCPAEKITCRAGGAALLRDIPAAVRLAEGVVRASRVPVTAKIRLGWNDGEIVAPSLAAALKEAGIAGIIVHGRTVEQQFAGPARLEEIGHVVTAAGPIPVIGNGGIGCPRDAADMIRQTGCAGVMIGRGALRDPWLFRDTHAFLVTGVVPEPPTMVDRIAFMNRHFDHLVHLKGERLACITFRQRASWYIGKLGDHSTFKHGVRTIVRADDYRRLVAKLMESVQCMTEENNHHGTARGRIDGLDKRSLRPDDGLAASRG
ncbi:MAG TPA: tRNA-dihydrouridine synthase [Phycisphaerae bacterium]|nr:tRNA-dihydrouridine synthase [Phycisphaerae bacterium]